MKTKLLMIALLASPLSAVSAEKADHYDSYFDRSTVTDLAASVEIYNNENGYWDNSQVLNSELRRYLIEKEVMSAEDETNGNWM